jgi:folate-binding protein YgfZ
MSLDALPGLSAASQHAAYFSLPDSGFITIGGMDRHSFLQRQTTNDVRLLKPGRPLFTVLTSATARILDVFCLVDLGETIAAIPLPGQSAASSRFLKSRIFFMDKVTVTDDSDQYTQILLWGPQTDSILEHWGTAGLPLSGQAGVFEIAGERCTLLEYRYPFGSGYRLIVPAQAARSAEKWLTESGMKPMDAQTLEILRIEAGLSWPGHELISDYTPLEVGLLAAVAENKGCYTGQEVIARQVSYDKVTQGLCGLYLEQPASQGDAVWIQERRVGTVTSGVISPRLGPLALAVVKRPHFEAGAQVLVGEAKQPARVARLPFEPIRP